MYVLYLCMFVCISKSCTAKNNAQRTTQRCKINTFRIMSALKCVFYSELFVKNNLERVKRSNKGFVLGSNQES